MNKTGILDQLFDDVAIKCIEDIVKNRDVEHCPFVFNCFKCLRLRGWASKKKYLKHISIYICEPIEIFLNTFNFCPCREYGGDAAIEYAKELLELIKENKK
jgi:hypothetical protein